MMKDAEILASFDGRGRTEFLIGGFEGRHSDRITAIGHELGYDLLSMYVPHRGVIRLVFVRNESPTARQRAQHTQRRLHTGGPLLQTWEIPGSHPGTSRTVSDVGMASTRRKLAAYGDGTNGGRNLAAVIAVLGLGCFALAWVLRDRPGAALAMVVLGAPLVVVAAVIPRWVKHWDEKSRRLVDLYDQQRRGPVAPPPPPPPAVGRTDQDPGPRGGR